MKVTTLNRANTGYFSQQQLDLCYNQEVYSDFITQPFSIQAFQSQLIAKQNSFSSEQRADLVVALKRQYQGVELSKSVAKNIELLSEGTTFTVTTGHQMVAMTGPLYFIYKIAHAIRLCAELKQNYPTYDFVPVYWMATEDHDYEEIKSFHLFGRTISWETQQTGAVGQFLMKDWDEVVVLLKDLFQNHPESDLFDWLKCFEGNNYAIAFRKLVNYLFEKHGIVIIDGDDTLLKKAFVPMMQKEINEQFAFNAIQSTTENLIKKGGKQQVMPREYNLFYIESGMRERLIAEGNDILIPQKGTYSTGEIVKWMEKSPELFSPNASMRPLYQEVILPNLCYIGGAGEINYWLQLKGVFDAVSIPYPLLKTRNSILWIDKATSDKINQLELDYQDLFKELHVLNKEYLEKNAADEIDFTEIQEKLAQLKNIFLETSSAIDPSLDKYMIAETVKLEKHFQQMQDQLYKSSKKKHEKGLKSLKQIKDRLFPEGNLQERYTNFLQLAPDGNLLKVIDAIVEHVQPSTNDFLIFEEE
ncbi:MAG: bacillithiol biosynthesis cysteine-adding enzyme BshC [Crocinitomicaceae bacterium]|nr:bacillithiol biosynthesis cysteine-adding enzyme BshC [Crocinitomicaceae bacterium]